MRKARTKDQFFYSFFNYFLVFIYLQGGGGGGLLVFVVVLFSFLFCSCLFLFFSVSFYLVCLFSVVC